MLKMLKPKLFSLLLLFTVTIVPNFAYSNPFAHANKGCPENSLCSPTSGIKHARWLKAIDQTLSMTSQRRAATLEKFRKNYGLPVLFLTTEKAKTALDPILWTSRCRHHNPKEKVLKIFKAQQFFVNNPKSKLVELNPVKIEIGKGKAIKNKIFHLPYGDQPLLIQNGKLVVTKDYEDILYHMSVDSKGGWKVVYIPSQLIRKAMHEREKVKCETKLKPGKFYLSNYCNVIWNADTKRVQKVEQVWSCS